MSQSPKFDTLVSASALPKLLERDDVILFDCRFDLMNPDAGEALFEQAHLPGAQYAHLDHDLSSPISIDSGRHPLPDQQKLARWLGEKGVDETQQVLIYDAQAGLFAARLWWLLRWLGHTNVAVINGGYQAALKAGIVTTSEKSVAKSRRFKLKPSLEHWVSTEELVQLHRQGQLRLVDVRAPERYRGEIEPIDSVAGHIPGAINIPLNSALNEQQCFRNKSELQQIYSERLGKYKANEPILMCGSGVTACHSRLAIATAGLAPVAIYPGSWSEWIRDPKRPIAKGD